MSSSTVMLAEERSSVGPLAPSRSHDLPTPSSGLSLEVEGNSRVEWGAMRQDNVSDTSKEVEKAGTMVIG